MIRENVMREFNSDGSALPHESRITNLLWLVALLLVAFAAPARAQTLAEKLEDARTAARVEVALAQDETLGAFSFRPTFRAGVLTVVGVVATPAQRDRVAEVAGGVEGVERVVNSVQVAGAAGDGGVPRLPPVKETVPAPAREAAPATVPAPEPAPAAVYHTVRSGDTLGAVARRYGVTVGEVQRLNGLRGSRIRIGQRLRVK